MLASILFAILATATAVSANSAAKQCTTTIVEPNQGCCKAPAATTVTSIDCHGCAIRTNPGFRCDIICEKTQTVPSSTRTHNVCKTSPTPFKTPIKIITTTLATTYTKPRIDAVADPSEPSPCTTAFHDAEMGCCAPRPAKTVTETVDCKGCVGVDVMRPHCQIACRVTLTDLLLTSTKTVCAASASGA